jgi:hypothetical protein
MYKLSIILICILTISAVGLIIFFDNYPGVQTTEETVELTIVDKDKDSFVIMAGKVPVHKTSYSITVDLGENNLYEFKCTHSEYNAVEIGDSVLFTLTLTEKGELIDIELGRE